MTINLPGTIRQRCREILHAEIRSVERVSGGDISQTRLLDTLAGRFFIKLNTGVQAAQMFGAEAKGLKLLADTGMLRIPEVIACEETAEGSFLLMEYVETGYRREGFWEEFGVTLAMLHRQTAPQFGLDHDNFIGSLPQSNRQHESWVDFFIHERLQPQLELALHANLLSANDARLFEKLYLRLPSICPGEPPALIHGDLWSGNFLVSKDSHPVLIDPAANYSHREMDLAMSRLFGGFDRMFYRSYEAAWPLSPGMEERLPVFQLYYLMVHVNLFGGSYVGSVHSVLSRFA